MLSSIAKTGTKIATLSAGNSSVDLFIDEYVRRAGDQDIGNLSLSASLEVDEDLVVYGNLYTSVLSATENGISV